MDPQDHIHLLFRRLISVFALADGWIDQWQSEVPGSNLYYLQFNVLSQMINAVSELDPINHAGAGGDGNGSCADGVPSGRVPKPANESANKMRKVLREHLGELLWLLDRQKEQGKSSPLTLRGGEIMDVVELATSTYKTMSVYVQQLESIGQGLEDFNSEPQHRFYPG